MAKRKFDSEIEELLCEITMSPEYHALPADALAITVHDALQIPDDDLGFPERFFDTLEQMCSDRELAISGKGNIINGAVLGFISGTYRANSKGFGFVTPLPIYAGLYPEDLFIGRANNGGAMNGDLVMVRAENRKESRNRFSDSDRSHSAEAVVLRIRERALKTVIGTLCKEEVGGRRKYTRWFVLPDDQKITADIHIAHDDLGNAVEGDKVEAEILRYPKPDDPDARGRIIAVFGETTSIRANYDVILHKNQIRTEFPTEVTAEAEEQKQRPVLTDGRLDLRDKIIFTIDGADSKDLDDAISLEKTENGWLLGVHIADVSDYVRERTMLDTEAFLRGTSVYFADQVVPMLPKALSNGICSLNAGEDRYALSALISLDKDGTISGCEIRESVIRSKIRGVYSELNDILANGKKSEFYEKYQILFPDVYPEMVHLYEILDAKNRAKGALELETAESKIIVDENGMPVDIVRRERGISECLIEQFMLCANEAVATWLYELGMPCVYRVHEEPPEDKIQTFAAFAYQLGLDIRSLKHKELHPMDMQIVMNEAKEKGLDGILSNVMLRSLSKARYSEKQGIHFGLATEFYCHFTSPIRRYPDLTVHRFLKTILHGKADAETTAKMERFSAKSAKQSSECELRAMTAERDIEDLYKVIYMEPFVGKEFEGIISSVTSFGFFVELDNTCEGLVPINTLDGYFHFDEKNLVLSAGHVQYHLGQRVRVELTRADRITRKLDMTLCAEEKTYAEARQTRYRRGKI